MMKKRNLCLLCVVFLFTQTQSLFSQDKLYPNTFPLGDIKLLDSPFKHACDLNVEVLLSYDTDRLLASFLREAGLSKKADSFSNWKDLDGHISGHYLSSLAIHYAATGDERCKQRMDYILSELKKCQDAHGNGYIGGIPDGGTMWEQVKNGDIRSRSFDLNGKWVPWYNIHKTFAGLRDAWAYGGSDLARQMFLDLCDWGLTIIMPLSQDQMENMLVTEFGGMNEVYADAYEMTGNPKYLNAAKKFSHKMLFEKMSVREDNLDNLHANTQVPKAVGYQRVAELDKDKDYITAAKFFWETVVNNRSLSFGGNSRREHFSTASACHEYTEEREGPESCNTNNMLKLTEGLFRMEPQVRYIDFYERAMFNHILSTQHPEHGGYVYFTSTRPRHYRVYSAPNQAMWCCVGTGMENHGKYGEFIYSHSGDSLFVNLFVASELTWKDKGIKIKQETRFPYQEGTKLTIEGKHSKRFSIMLRYPSWVKDGDLSIHINGKVYNHTSAPGSFIKIDRKWKPGDVITLETPMHVTIEEMPNVPEYISILRGPILLAARSGIEDLKGLVANEDRMAHIAYGELLPLTDAPVIVGERGDILHKLNNMQSISDKPFHFRVPELFQLQRDKDIELEPFYGIHDSRYMIYWLSMTENEYGKAKDEFEKAEHEKMVLDNRTIDDVKPGEQQPEVDHSMKSQNSHSGNHHGKNWRDARDGGYFSYNLNTKNHDRLLLMVRYWGNETGNRSFDIFIDDKLLTTEDLVNKWNENTFINLEYPIPAEMLHGKQMVKVSFRAKENNVAGGVFRVRIVKSDL